MRLSKMAWDRRTIGVGAAVAAAAALLIAGAVLTTLALSSSNEAARLREELQADLDEALVAQTQLAARDAVITELRTQIDSLEGEMDTLDANLASDLRLARYAPYRLLQRAKLLS